VTGEAVRGPETGEGALLVGLVLPGDAPTREPPLAELGRLAETAGAVVLGTTVQKRSRLHPATCVGTGKAEEIRLCVESEKADVVLVDHALSPAQERNLERLLGCRVLDRTGLILDIFALRQEPRGQAAGGAGPAEIPAAAPGRP